MSMVGQNAGKISKIINMNYYKGLEKIGETGDFKKISNELLRDYIKDFTLEYNSRNLAKKIIWYENP